MALPAQTDRAVLRALNDGPLTMTEISRKTGYGHRAVRNAVDRLSLHKVTHNGRVAWSRNPVQSLLQKWGLGNIGRSGVQSAHD